MTLFSKTVAERTRPGQRQDVEEQSYTFHAYARSEGVAGIIISDQEYPALVAHQLLGKILDEFLSRYPRSAFASSNAALAYPELKDYITKYQDPQQADSIMKVSSLINLTRVHCAVMLNHSYRFRRSLTRPRSSSTKPSSLCLNVARSSTRLFRNPTASAHRARCSTRRQRNRTHAAS